MEGSAIAAVVVLVLVSLILMVLGFKKYRKIQLQTQADIEKQSKLPSLPKDETSKVSESTIPAVLHDQNQPQATAPNPNPNPNLDRVAQEFGSLPKGAESPMMGRKRAPTLQKNPNPSSVVNLADSSTSNSASATDAKIQQVIGSVRVRSASFKKKEGEAPVFKAPEI